MFRVPLGAVLQLAMSDSCVACARPSARYIFDSIENVIEALVDRALTDSIDRSTWPNHKGKCLAKQANDLKQLEKDPSTEPNPPILIF